VVGLASGATAIAVGGLHTCARLQSGTLKCWGSNFAGQLGDGTDSGRLTPVDTVGLEGVVTGVAGGQFHTCAQFQNGGVKCWGSNAHGELGTGRLTMR
jgi:alpha-tubulin suppressor-like RCC1 family protein